VRRRSLPYVAVRLSVVNAQRLQRYNMSHRQGKWSQDGESTLNRPTICCIGYTSDGIMGDEISLANLPQL